MRTDVAIDRCPSCNAAIMPGVDARRCFDCRQPLCDRCKKIWEAAGRQFAVCRPCWNRRMVKGMEARQAKKDGSVDGGGPPAV